jgi:2'-5' RNA ligase
MRLFTAILLPPEARQHLAQLQEGKLRDPAIKRVSPERLHITLKFLGEVEPERADAVRTALRAIEVRPMRLRAEGAVCFPERGRIRVIAAGVGGDAGEVIDLFARVSGACERIGFAAEGRAFTPHITLARARDGTRRDRLDLSPPDAWIGPPFVAKSFALVESLLRAGGPVYSAVEEFGESQNF